MVTGDWEAAASRDVEAPVEQPPPSPGSWGEIGSRAPGATSQPPIGKSTQPAMIRPPGVSTAGVVPGTHPGSATRSMADLFKSAAEPAGPKQSPVAAPTPVPTPTTAQDPPSSSTTSADAGQYSAADTGQYSSEAQPETSGEGNGWGALPSVEVDSSRQNSSLGGVAISAPRKTAPSQQLPIQSSGAAGNSGTLFPGQTPVGSLTNVASSPQRKHDESPRNHTAHQAWGTSAPNGSSGLGGELVAPPPRQQYSSETPSLSQQSWQPKASLSHPPAGQSTLGSAVMSSLAPTSMGPAPSGSVDGGLPTSAASPRAGHQLGVSGSAFSNHSPVVMPHANHQDSNELSNLKLSFGSFNIGGGGAGAGAAQDTGAFSSGFSSSFQEQAATSHAHSQTDLPASLGPAAQLHDPYKQSYQSQPQSQQQQQMNARAYNAFTSASSGLAQAPSSAASQRITPPAFQPEASSAASNTSSSALYGSQAQQGYVGQGYAGYSLPAGQQQAYQNYSAFQVPEQEHTPAASHAVSQAAATPALSNAASTKNSLPYDTNSYANYSHGGGKEFQPAPKYGGSATQATNLAAAPATAQHLAAVAAQTPLQVPSMTSYGSGQSTAPQPYGGYAQQGYNASSNYPQSYANSSYGHSGTGYAGGVGGGYQQPQMRNSNPYQQQPQAGYGGQAAKYGGGGYSAGGGYQHGGGSYGVQGHKQEKDHQASHLGSNLYGAQLQQPLAGQGQHFQNAGLQANPSYGTYPQNQGYNSASYGGMGGAQGRQQYPNQFYGGRE